MTSRAGAGRSALRVRRPARRHLPWRGARRAGWLVVLVAALATCGPAYPMGNGAPAGAEAEPPVPEPRSSTVLLFGDSLTTEAGDMVATLLAGEHDVRVSAVGGTALCDALGAIEDAVAEHDPALVVLQFSGNAMTPCMRPDGGDPTPQQYLALYRRAADEVIEELAPTDVGLLLVGSPPKPDDVRSPVSTDDALRQAAEVAADDGRSVGFVEAGSAVSDADGRWTATLPCLPFENGAMGCTDGRIAVRSRDRGHFCPGEWDGPDGQIPRCQVWSSGAFRYALAISDAAREALGRS